MTDIEIQNHIMRIVLDDPTIRALFEVSGLTNDDECKEMLRVSEALQASGRRLAYSLKLLGGVK